MLPQFWHVHSETLHTFEALGRACPVASTKGFLDTAHVECTVASSGRYCLRTYEQPQKRTTHNAALPTKLATHIVATNARHVPSPAILATSPQHLTLQTDLGSNQILAWPSANKAQGGMCRLFTILIQIDSTALAGEDEFSRALTISLAFPGLCKLFFLASASYSTWHLPLAVSRASRIELDCEDRTIFTLPEAEPDCTTHLHSISCKLVLQTQQDTKLTQNFASPTTLTCPLSALVRQICGLALSQLCQARIRPLT